MIERVHLIIKQTTMIKPVHDIENCLITITYMLNGLFG